MPEGMIKARKRLLADEASPPSHYIDVVNAPWETSKFPGIEHKVLSSDTGHRHGDPAVPPRTGARWSRCMNIPAWSLPMFWRAAWKTRRVCAPQATSSGVPAGNTHEARAPIVRCCSASS